MKHLLASASVAALATLPRVALAQDDAFDLGTITVSASQTPVETKRIGTSVEVVTEEELEKSSGALATDIFVQTPGISVTGNGPAGTSTNLRIRGAQEKFAAVYIDGIKVNDPSDTNGAFGNFGSLTSIGLNRIEILKGAQSASYGGAAIAGAVNIYALRLDDAPEGTRQHIDLMYGSYDTLGSGYSFSQNQGPLTLAFALSHLQSNGFSAADENAGNTEADSMRETRMSFGALYKMTDNVTIGFNGFIEDGTSEFDEFGPSDGTPGDEIANRKAVGLRTFAKVDAGLWNHELSLSYFKVERQLSSVGAFSYDNQFSATRRRFEYTATGELSSASILSLGFDIEQEGATYNSLTSGTETVMTRGIFAELNYAASKNLDLIGTLRVDDHSEFGSELTGRVAFSWRPGPNLTLRGAISDGYRAPSIDQLYGNYPDPGFPFVGNPNLTPETSKSIEFGAEYTFENEATVSATVFRTDTRNLIDLAPCPTFPCTPGTSNSLKNVAGISKTNGFELAGTLPLSYAIKIRGAYTYLDAASATGNQLIRVPKHDFVLGVEAELTDKLSGQLVLNHVAGRANEGANAMPDYTVVNASMTYDFNDTTQGYVRLENLTNEQYQTSYGYGTSDRAIYFGVRASF